MPREAKASFSLRLATTRAKYEPLFLFTAGLYESRPLVELGMVLEKRWPILRDYTQAKSAFSFPQEALIRIAKAQDRELKEGAFFTSDDPLLADLHWPKGVKALVAVDHEWDPKLRRVVDEEGQEVVEEDDSSDKSESAGMNETMTDDTVIILTLAPVMETQKITLNEKTALKWAQGRRKATWKKVCLPLVYE